MNKSFISIEIDDNKVKNIMERLDNAQEEIYSCYNELLDLGVLKISKVKEGENPPPVK